MGEILRGACGRCPPTLGDAPKHPRSFDRRLAPPGRDQAVSRTKRLPAHKPNGSTLTDSSSGAIADLMQLSCWSQTVGEVADFTLKFGR